MNVNGESLPLPKPIKYTILKADEESIPKLVPLTVELHQMLILVKYAKNGTVELLYQIDRNVDIKGNVNVWATLRHTTHLFALQAHYPRDGRTTDVHIQQGNLQTQCKELVLFLKPVCAHTHFCLKRK